MAKARQKAPQSGRRRSRAIRQSDYARLSEFRYLIRQFLKFSQEKARSFGLTPQQHQALLAIKGFPSARAASVGDLAERLGIRHSSAVELADRLCKAKLVVRKRDPSDQRRVLLSITTQAEHRLADLSAAHLDELDRIRPMLRRLIKARETKRGR